MTQPYLPNVDFFFDSVCAHDLIFGDFFGRYVIFNQIVGLRGLNELAKEWQVLILRAERMISWQIQN
jgi:hypothetical protein